MVTGGGEWQQGAPTENELEVMEASNVPHGDGGTTL